MNARVEIAGRAVGEGAPVLFIAEAGVNHNGSLETALELVDRAAESGADAIKFQTFAAEDLAAAAAQSAGYQQERTGEASQAAMLSALELTADAFKQIAERAADRGIMFLSTPFDEASADLLVELDVPAIKVSSGDLTALPFLGHLAKLGKPLLLSTGMATMEEVEAAVGAVRGAELVLLHCVSAYPAPPEEANLKAMDTLRDRFGVPVGLSDHCLGPETTLAAAARGAAVIERHFTLDRRSPGPDHAMSLPPKEMAELIRQVRTVESALGDGSKRPQPSETENAELVRRSVVATRDLDAGQTIGEADVTLKRPATGIAPGKLGRVVGARLARPVGADQPVTEEDLE